VAAAARQANAQFTAGGPTFLNEGPTMSDEKHEVLHVTVLVNGLPEQHEFRANDKVRKVIRDLLKGGEKEKPDDYELVDRDLGTNPLSPDQTLAEAGVRTGHTLSLTKKDGGGGLQ
jgi:hypothetical protein